MTSSIGSQSESDEIRLFFSVLGPHVENVLMADILPNKIVADLRTLVRLQFSSEVNVDRLVIWRVSKPHH